MEKSYDASEVDQCCDDLSHVIRLAADLSLKVRSNHVKSKTGKKDKLGFDGHCRNLKNKVLSLGNLVQKFPSDPVIYGNFQKTKKEFKRIVKKKHREAREKLLQRISDCQDKDPTTFWKMLNKLRESRIKKNPIPTNEWTAYFKKLHNTSLSDDYDNKFTEIIESKLDMLFDNNSTQEVLDREFTMEEIKTGIKVLKNKKACGPDSITNEMLKVGQDELAGLILKLFNLVLKTETFPQSWTTGFIVPVYKSGWDLDPSNYRGLSITSCIGKLFCMLINNRLMNKVEAEGIISPSQIGFRKGKRTSDHVFVLKCIIEEAKARRQPVFSCFVDLKKAFDTVWRGGLFYKLMSYYKISAKYCRMFKNMYCHLKGRVKTDMTTGDEFNISIGLRQGCNLSPSLFNLYINDLPELLRKADCDPVKLCKSKINILMYADDMVLLSNSANGLQKALHILEAYCRKWHLVVNTKKTQIIIFNSKARQTYKLGGVGLENVLDI
jgi:hypothetical protein